MVALAVTDNEDFEYMLRKLHVQNVNEHAIHAVIMRYFPAIHQVAVLFQFQDLKCSFLFLFLFYFFELISVQVSVLKSTVFHWTSYSRSTLVELLNINVRNTK